MPADSATLHLNLEYYRKQAKTLLKAARAGEPAALERFARQSSRFDAAAPKLHDAQLTVAREQGFASWPRFRAFVVESGLDDQGLVAAFIDAATSDLRRAEEMLAAHPRIEGAGYFAALVLGNRKAVERTLAQAPALATGPRGPQKVEPLVYVCFSRFARGGSSRAAGIVETARILLRRDADPNAFLIPEDLPDNPLSCLYAATGLNNNVSLGLLLLEAGANPNDNESLYHSTEHADLACVKMLLQYGAGPSGTNALKHMLDREDPEGVRLLLAAGADPNETNENGETALFCAVRRGRSVPIVAALLDAGANIDARRKEGWTAYAYAVHSRQQEVARLLVDRGAATDLPTVDRPHLLVELAQNHHVQAVRELLDEGVPSTGRGELGATALHWACWTGDAAMAELLLNHGASLTATDLRFDGTPAGWFCHGLHNCCGGNGDYARVARLLLAAGATLPASDVPTGKHEVDAVLREYGLI